MARRGGPLRHGPAALASALGEAVAAAAAADLGAYEESVGRLALLDGQRVRGVAGAVVRGLLEERHPGGLTGDDVGDVLQHAATRGLWLPDLDPTVLLLVVTGALGLLDADDQPAELSPTAVLRHAPLLVASLLHGAGLEPRLDAALAELRRAETVELP